MRIVYSRDDQLRTGRGWYWEDDSWRTSQSFQTYTEAEKADRDGRLVWGPVGSGPRIPWEEKR